MIQKRYPDWPFWEKVFYPCFLLLMTGMTVYTKGSVPALIASLLCFTGATLNTKARWDAYVYNAAGALIYGAIALSSRNYGEAVLAFFYNAPCYVWAIVKWARVKDAQEATSGICEVGKRKLITLSLLCTVGALVYGLLLRKVGSHNPFANAIATGACVGAIYLASNRCIEQWAFWTVFKIS